ncbi:MAG: glycosyl hydrolase [Methyloprofundus sp.]|nr:glycosyl hydrolase [Methyloprofundus sp.]
MAVTIIIDTLLIISLWLLGWLFFLLLRYATDIKKLLSEPMLKHPVIIFESDDWGTGPLKQQNALVQISELLSRFSDSKGQHPVMTLGIILAEPDIDKIKATDGQVYHKRTLADTRYIPLLEIIHKGVAQGVFSVHLHGMEHFWPASLMHSVDKNAKVKQWLFANDNLQTEDLPSELQSRWVDSSCLPSSEHSEEDIYRAIDEELRLYKNIFGQAANIVVPPTFVWTDIVEQAYAAQGIETMITPGRQCIGRDKQGQPAPNGRYFFNGEENEGLLFLVRDDYFEPALGHKAETVLQRISDKIKCGRPALLEMHRFNFINGAKNNTTSLQELEKLLQLIVADLSDARFISAEQLATIIRNDKRGINSEYMLDSSLQRFKVILARVKLLFQFNSFAKYSGINLLLKLV